MADLKNVFELGQYQTLEAKRQILQSQAKELIDFVKTLKEKKAIVYTAIMTESIVGFNGVVTLSSLLLQMNLYCRRNNSLMLLKQLKADELTEAILSFYDGTYIKMREYARFVKKVFAIIV